MALPPTWGWGYPLLGHMPNSYTTYTANGTDDRFVAPTYDSDISTLAVLLDDVEQGSGWSYDSDTGEVVFDSPPSAAVVVKIQRSTAVDSPVTSFSGGQIRSAALNNAILQLLHWSQEWEDLFGDVVAVSGTDLTTMTGILPVANGGTGSAVASTARSNLGAQTQADILDELAAATVAQGDIFYINATGNLVRLPKGTNGQYLKLVTNLPAWATVAGGGADANGLASINGFRLGLSAGDPVFDTTSGTLYLTPFRSHSIALYDGVSDWSLHTSAEISLALSGLTASTVYDIFAYDNAGTLTLEAVAWYSTSQRTVGDDPLDSQNGVLHKIGDSTKRYVGTIYVDASKQCTNGGQEFHVWNYANRIPRPFRVLGDTAGWTYTSATWRMANADSTKKISFVTGDHLQGENFIYAFVQVAAYGDGALVTLATDGTSPSTFHSTVGWRETADSNPSSIMGVYMETIEKGLHDLNWIEKADNGTTVTFIGDAADRNSSMRGFLYV